MSSASERTPLLDNVTHPLAKALELAFGCRHANLSRVFTINRRCYKVCCDCGMKFDYSLETMSIVRRRRRRGLRRALRHWRVRHSWMRKLAI
jgi:hypothetical protein